MNRKDMQIQGRCHCGNINLSLTWEPDPKQIQARRCVCKFCAKHGARWTSHPSGVLLVQVNERARVSIYQHGTQTADFHICRGCGVVPLVTSTIGGVLHAVVNVNTFEGLNESLLVETAVSYEDEDEAGRLVRRQRNWIGQVRVQGAS
jgi:hypothetical protein